MVTVKLDFVKEVSVYLTARRRIEEQSPCAMGTVPLRKDYDDNRGKTRKNSQVK
jgi:hypothetical protein